MYFLWTRGLACGLLLTAAVGCASTRATKEAAPRTVEARREVLAEALAPRKRAEAYAAGAEKLAQDGFPRDAIEQYQKARSVDPRLPGVAHRLAVLYDREGDFERAAPEYAAALAERPQDADVWNDYGYFLQQQESHAEAERALRKALELSPGHARAEGNLALVLAETGREQEALALYERLVGPAAARSNVGLILARRGRAEEARRLLEEAVALDPALKPARAGLALVSPQPADPSGPLMAAGGRTLR